MVDFDFDISGLGMDEYPFEGEFYKLTVDMEADLDKRVPVETSVLKTKCDVQKNSRLHNGSLLGADYTVYFPLPENPDATGTVDRYGPVNIRRGMRFRGKAYGYTYDGEVEIVRMSQLGGCSVDIKILKESEVNGN